jgi:metal-sulfur cluster biosynthetic enzyme
MPRTLLRVGESHLAISPPLHGDSLALAVQSSEMSDRKALFDALVDVVDSELGINIVDLGLVYEATLQNSHVHVVMTMTTAACPLGESITEQVREAIQRRIPGVVSVSVDFVWEPQWKPSMMSAAARERLGWR